MKKLEQFKTENEGWLESIISDYVDDMTFEKGININPSDYFTDTLFIVRERCQDEDLALEVKDYIESEVIKKIK